METNLHGAATPEAIENWKSKHGHVFQVTVEDATAYFKKPSRQTLRAVLGFLDKDKIRAMEVLAENCWLGGDERIKTDDDYFISAMPYLNQLVEVKDADIKKI